MRKAHNSKLNIAHRAQLNIQHCAQRTIRVKILVNMEDIPYLCRKKEGVYEYQRISFDIYGRTNRCHAS